MADPKPIDDLLEPGLINDLLESGAKAMAPAVANPDRYHQEVVEDAANMAPAGATGGFDDKIAGVVSGLGAMLRDPLKNPAQTFPKAYDQGKAERNLSKAESMDRSPFAGAAGYGAGAVATGQGLKRAGAALPGAVGKLVQMAGGESAVAEGAGLAARAGTVVGNLALPGAIAGAGEANSLEELPEAVAEGVAWSAGMGGALKGVAAARSGMAKAGPWARTGYNKTTLASTGHEGGVLADIAKEPGGHEARVELLQRHGIGTGLWPSPAKTVDKAEGAVETLNAQRAGIADRAGDVRIRSADNESAIRNAAQQNYPTTAMRGTRAKVEEEALAQGQGGTPIYEPAQGQVVTGSPNALARRGQPQGPQLMQETGRERTLAEQQAEISAYNSRAYNERRALNSEGADVSRVAGRAMNDHAEGVLEKIEPGLGVEWRGNKHDTAGILKTHEAAVNTASKDPKLTNMFRGAGRGMVAAGVGAGNPVVAAAGAVGEAMSHPQVRRLGYMGVGTVSRAAERLPNNALGRILAKLPGAQFGGAALRAGKMSPEVEESMLEVQRAAMENPEKGAQTHYIESETNPAYRAAANKVEK